MEETITNPINNIFAEIVYNVKARLNKDEDCEK